MSYNDQRPLDTKGANFHVSDATIEVTGLRKRFGACQALDGMTFSVMPGRVTGFVGPNGAGKSTTIRVILGLDAPDEGHALVCGEPYKRLRQPLKRVGALIDAAALQPSRTGRNHLLWMARSQRISPNRVDAVIDFVGLGSVAQRKAGGYSLGMRQRLGIAAAMLGDPPVIIMDEPFNGMDPEGIIWMRRLLRSLASEGRAILISSHLMSEVQDVADHVVVVGRGRVLADSSVDELIGRVSSEHIRVRTSAAEALIQALQRVGARTSVIDSDTVDVSGIEAHRLVETLSQAHIPFSEVTAQRATLEDVYLQVTGGAVEFGGTSDREGNR
jgi:ABC-2 type transport system ATP-binding protein